MHAKLCRHDKICAFNCRTSTTQTTIERRNTSTAHSIFFFCIYNFNITRRVPQSLIRICFPSNFQLCAVIVATYVWSTPTEKCIYWATKRNYPVIVSRPFKLGSYRNEVRHLNLTALNANKSKHSWPSSHIQESLKLFAVLWYLTNVMILLLGVWLHDPKRKHEYQYKWTFDILSVLRIMWEDSFGKTTRTMLRIFDWHLPYCHA